jgi:hypothetical protein
VPQLVHPLSCASSLNARSRALDIATPHQMTLQTRYRVASIVGSTQRTRAKLRRPSEREGGVCCKAELDGCPTAGTPASAKGY